MKDYGTLMLVEFIGDPYNPLGGNISSFGRLTITLWGLSWIVGWKVALLRLGCDIPSLCNYMYLLDYSNTKLFP